MKLPSCACCRRPDARSVSLMHSAGFKCESGASAASAGIANGVAAVAAVPEPETYAMMLAGLGLLGYMARRRKQQAA